MGSCAHLLRVTRSRPSPLRGHVVLPSHFGLHVQRPLRLARIDPLPRRLRPLPQQDHPVHLRGQVRAGPPAARAPAAASGRRRALAAALHVAAVREPGRDPRVAGPIRAGEGGGGGPPAWEPACPAHPHVLGGLARGMRATLFPSAVSARPHRVPHPPALSSIAVFTACAALPSEHTG